MKGNFDSKIGVEFYIEGFPYKVQEGEEINPSNNYYAMNDGNFTYVTTFDTARTIFKLNYFKPCARPQNGGAVEASLQKSEVEKSDQAAAANQAIADTANARLQEFKKKIEDQKKEEIEAANRVANAPKEKILKWNQEQAEKGEPYGLLRMGERYRDGDGVLRDLKKAREYLQKAADAGSDTAKAELQNIETTAKKSE